MKQVVWCAAILTIIAVLISGCSSKSGSPLSQKGAAVKIGYYSEEQYVERYGDKLEQSYPNLTYSVIPAVDLLNGKQDPRSWSEENRVDVMYVPGSYMSEFIANDLIINLDALIKMHKFDLTAYYPGVIRYLRNLGQGSIYGIPPAMNGNVLVYNKKMLEEKALTYPAEQPSWEQVLQLASFFPGKGLALPWASPEHLALKMGEGSGLPLFKQDPIEVTLSSEEWQSFWLSAASTLESKSVKYDVSNLDCFLAEKCVMAIMSSNNYNLLRLASTSFDYGFTSMPIGTGDVRLASDMSADGFLAISSSTQSTETAFELLQLFLSPSLNEWSQTGDLGVPTLQQSSSVPFAEAMYALEPAASVVLPELFYEQGAAAIQELAHDPSDVQGILQNLEIKLEKALRK